MAQSTDHNNETGEVQPPVSLYSRPGFWLGTGLIAGIILLLILFLLKGCGQEPLPLQNKAVDKAEEPNRNELLLLRQKAINRSLEEEAARLRALLAEDPCVLADILGAPAGRSSAPTTPGVEKTDPAPPPAGDAQPVQHPPDAAPTPAPPPAVIGELMESATVFVLSSYDDSLGMGSGFFVAPGVIATNSHVVRNPSAKVTIGNKALGGMREAQVIAFSSDPSRDYALLRINSTLAAKTPVLSIRDGAKRTERVSAWGFPGYIAEIDPKLAALAEGDGTAVPEVVYSEGVVSVVLDHTPPVILHTASLSQGNSGGPLINADGQVVGINTFIKTADKSYSQTNIALPGGDLVHFLREHGIPVVTQDKSRAGE